MKPKHKQYKIGTGILPEKIKFNHCQKLLNQTIYSIRNIKVGTIEYNLEEKKRVCFNQDESFIVPFVSNEPAIFSPSFKTYKSKNRLKVTTENRIFFISIVKDGKIIENKLAKENVYEKNFIVKSVPNKNSIVFDKNNMRIRLIGYKSSPEWVKIDKMPLYIRGNK